MLKLGELTKINPRLSLKNGRPATKPVLQQERTLRKLLRKASGTAFGQYYNFKELLRSHRMMDDFCNRIPIYDYDQMFDRWWHMTLRNVENVSWPGRVKYFALSSGTSGAPSKRIPVTEDMMKVMRKGATSLFFTLPKFKIEPELLTKGMLMLGGTTDLKDEDGNYQGDLSGISATRLPFWLRPYYKPGAKISRISDWNQRIEEIVKNAPHWDVGFMIGIPAWLQLVMEKIIEQHQVANIHKIWPNLKMCIHGGVHFEPYKKGFEKLLAHPLVYVDTYLASEGFIAYQARPETRAMKLLMKNGIFFEFIPFNEDNFDVDGSIIGTPKTFNIGEVETGINYALVISTCGGSWRYLIGDTLEFTDIERKEIIITGRTKHYLSICGEHLSVDNMNQGIQKLQEKLQISIPEFTVSAIRSGRFFAHKWYLGCEPQPNPNQALPILDQALKSVNDDYATERSSVLKDIQVEVIPPQIFYQWQESKGKMGGQNKFPRVMKKEQFREWENFVRQHPSTQ